MEKQKTRKEIADKYKWDLTRIYKTDECWYNDLKNAEEMILKFKDYEGKLFASSESLSSYLKLDEETKKLFNKLASYSSLKMSEDSTNFEYQKMSSLLKDLFVKLSDYTSFVDEEFFATDFEKILKLLNSSDYLKTYIKVFERKNRYRDHYLSKEKEQIFNIFQKTLYTPSDIYSMLTEAEMKFASIKDEDNNDVEITQSNYIKYQMSKDRRIRKDSFNAYYKTFENLKNTIALAYVGDVDATIASNKVHNFNDSRFASLYSDNIDLLVYDNLIESVHNNLQSLYKYYDMKKNILNLDEFHIYDMYAKVVDSTEKNYTYEEAKETVLKALSPLGEEYIKKATNIFNNNLVDVYNNVGKTTGAFSSETYDTDPYILLNFEGKYNDVSTIAHELGHSMHTTYSNESNLRQYADYKIFVAEVASTVNEFILSDYMLKNSKDKKEQLAIINDLLDNYKASIYRQTMFAEFEREMYQRREANKPLTNEDISNYYYDLNKLYFGDNVFVDEAIKYEWERIPHFYNAFYVYKYSTSMAASVYIADKIISGDTEFRDKYINFLKMGCSEFPIDELKTLGIDMTKSDVVNEALHKFEILTKKFEQLYNEIKNEVK